MENLLSEAFQRLSLLEQDFDFSTVDKDKVDELSAFIADDVEEIPEEPIIDVNAETEDDLADNYIGKVILECECCHTRIYKNFEDVVIDDEAGLANIDEACPVCNNSLGYSVIGKIEAFDSEREIEPEDNEEEIPEETPEEVADDIEIEDEEEKEESLKSSKTASEDSKKLDESNSWAEDGERLANTEKELGYGKHNSFAKEGERLKGQKIDKNSKPLQKGTASSMPGESSIKEANMPLKDRLARKHFDSLLGDTVEEAIDPALKDKKPVKGAEPFTAQADPAAVKKVFEIIDSMSDEDYRAFNDASMHAYAPLEKGDDYKRSKIIVNKLLRKYHLPSWALEAFAENWDEEFDEALTPEEQSRMDAITKNGIVKASDRNEYRDLRNKEKDEAYGDRKVTFNIEYVDNTGGISNEFIKAVDEEEAKEKFLAKMENHPNGLRKIKSIYQDDDDDFEDFLRGHDWFDESVNEELLDHGNDNLEASSELATKDTKSLEDDQTELVHAAGDKIEAINESSDVCSECGKNPCVCEGCKDDLDEACDNSYDNKFDKDFDDAVDALEAEEDNFNEAFPDDLPDVWGGHKVEEDLNESVELHTDGESVDLVKNDDGSISLEVGSSGEAPAEEVGELAPEEPVGAEEIVPLEANDQASIESNELETEEDEFAEEPAFEVPAEDEFAEEPAEEEGEEPFESLAGSDKPAINESANKGDTIQDKIAKEELKQAKIETKMMQLDLAAKQAEAEAVAPVEEPVEEEPVEDELPAEDAELLDNIEEVDESLLDKICEAYMRKVYSNVASYKTSSIKLGSNTAMIEGIINFNSGKSKTTTFNFFSPTMTRRGKLVMEGSNSTFTQSPKAFRLKCTVNENKLLPESMIYTYTSKHLNESNEQEVLKIYGRVKA